MTTLLGVLGFAALAALFGALRLRRGCSGAEGGGCASCRNGACRFGGEE